MRLTPFRNRFITDADEGASAGASTVDVHIYEASASGAAVRGAGAARSNASHSDADVVAFVERHDAPVTVDQITDHLTAARGPVNVDAWGDVHERLHRIDLPALDAAGKVDFDPTRGTVEPASDAGDRKRYRPATRHVATFVVAVGLVSASVAMELPVPVMAMSVTAAAAAGLVSVRTR